MGRIKELVVLHEEDDEELKDMLISQLAEAPCDICGKEDADRMYVLRLDDGNIYALCEQCFKKNRLVPG